MNITNALFLGEYILGMSVSLYLDAQKPENETSLDSSVALGVLAALIIWWNQVDPHIRWTALGFFTEQADESIAKAIEWILGITGHDLVSQAPEK